MDKPILLSLTLKTGLSIDGARVQYEAPRIAGFLAIESPDIKHSTTYIALDHISSFTVLDEEICNILSSFPIPAIKVKNCRGDDGSILDKLLKKTTR